MEKVSREQEIEEPAEPTNPDLPTGMDSEPLLRCTVEVESGKCDRLFKTEKMFERHVDGSHPEVEDYQDVLNVVEPEVA